MRKFDKNTKKFVKSFQTQAMANSIFEYGNFLFTYRFGVRTSEPWQKHSLEKSIPNKNCS